MQFNLAPILFFVLINTTKPSLLNSTFNPVITESFTAVNSETTFASMIILLSTYLSNLTINSETFFYYNDFYSGTKFYYETIELNVSANAYHYLPLNGRIPPQPMLYKKHFNPTSLELNKISISINSNYIDEPRFRIRFNNSVKYILVVTAFKPNVTEPFEINAFASSILLFSQINISTKFIFIKMS
ncbi:unnamed protein product [Rotaria socialis]|uniref:Uncharacterized protein n=2 Tax=Rotaria socialis TaxID=392032 RepID=A0A821G8L9_9BILA|nr:unnamed protein product [Rotaria socialis]